MIESTGRLAQVDETLCDGRPPAATTPLDSPLRRAVLLAMVKGLRANQGIVDELAKGYTMFRFTGGTIASQRWELTALGRYLKQPCAVDRIAAADAQRYRQLAVDIMTLGQTIAESGPKALPRRFDLADRFDEMSADIHRLGARLDIALNGLLEESALPTRQTKENRALESVE